MFTSFFMNESSKKKVIERYNLSADELFCTKGLRLSHKGFIRLEKEHPCNEYSFNGTLTARYMLQLYKVCEFPYYIPLGFKKIYIFGDEVNTIIRLLGDDIYRWLDNFTPSEYIIKT